MLISEIISHLQLADWRSREKLIAATMLIVEQNGLELLVAYELRRSYSCDKIDELSIEQAYQFIEWLLELADSGSGTTHTQ